MANNFTEDSTYSWPDDDEIQYILTTDKVLGDPAGTQGALTGPINVLLQKIVNRLAYLKNNVFKIDDNIQTRPMNVLDEVVFRDVSVSGKPMGRNTIQRILDLIPTATTTKKGILEIATTSEATARTATDKIITPATLPNTIETNESPDSIYHNSTDNVLLNVISFSISFLGGIRIASDLVICTQRITINVKSYNGAGDDAFRLGVTMPSTPLKVFNSSYGNVVGQWGQHNNNDNPTGSITVDGDKLYLNVTVGYLSHSPKTLSLDITYFAIF